MRRKSGTRRKDDGLSLQWELGYRLEREEENRQTKKIPPKLHRKGGKEKMKRHFLNDLGIK